MLRCLFEWMPNLHAIGARLLLDFALRDSTYSMPLGRIEFLHLTGAAVLGGGVEARIWNH